MGKKKKNNTTSVYGLRKNKVKKRKPYRRATNWDWVKGPGPGPRSQIKEHEKEWWNGLWPNGLFGEAPPERASFFRLQIYEGREGGYQIPVPSLNLAQIPVPRLIFAKIPVNKSLEFSVCITALFALTYLISSTILRETFFWSHFYLPFTISSHHMQTCRTCPLTRKTDRT